MGAHVVDFAAFLALSHPEQLLMMERMIKQTERFVKAQLKEVGWSQEPKIYVFVLLAEPPSHKVQQESKNGTLSSLVYQFHQSLMSLVLPEGGWGFDLVPVPDWRALFDFLDQTHAPIHRSEEDHVVEVSELYYHFDPRGEAHLNVRSRSGSSKPRSTSPTGCPL
jgi:hypothetical protein